MYVAHEYVASYLADIFQQQCCTRSRIRLLVVLILTPVYLVDYWYVECQLLYKPHLLHLQRHTSSSTSLESGVHCYVAYPQALPCDGAFDVLMVNFNLFFIHTCGTYLVAVPGMKDA